MKKVLVNKDSYVDSVFLMALSKELKARPGVHDAVVSMGTPANLELLEQAGYDPAAFKGAGPADLVLAVSADDPDAALEDARALLTKKRAPASGGGVQARPRSLEGALERLPEANLAIVSLPGVYAAREARKALEKGLHVMLFSDNVSLEEEIALKTFADSKGLLVMGPDCGSAIIGGAPLCFANAVARGPVGIVAASGTGLQEVTCLVDRMGSGISQAIGTGGRDLKNEKVGGITMLAGIKALAADPGTKVIVVVSKPPARSVADKVTAALVASGKPCVVHFIGLEPSGAAGWLSWASNLEEAARMAVALAKGEAHIARDFDMGEAELGAIVAGETARRARGQKYVRGYFTGGTLADEAWLILHRLTKSVSSNNQTDPAFVLKDPRRSVGHTVVDLGDDVFTVGRPHPMIDPSTRTDRVDAEAADSEIAVMLVDVVLGYGSCADPAGSLLPSLVAAKEAAARRGGYLSVVASVTGVAADFQGLEAQKDKLRRAGVVVMPSNHQACLMAARILGKAGAR